MRIPKKMIKDEQPIIKTVTYQTGFEDSQWGGSYIYKNNHATHIGARIVKTEGFFTNGEVIFGVGDEFAPKLAVNGNINRYIQGYAAEADAIANIIGGVAFKVEPSGLVAIYLDPSLTDKVKSVIIPEQQYII